MRMFFSYEGNVKKQKKTARNNFFFSPLLILGLDSSERLDVFK